MLQSNINCARIDSPASSTAPFVSLPSRLRMAGFLLPVLRGGHPPGHRQVLPGAALGASLGPTIRQPRQVIASRSQAERAYRTIRSISHCAFR